MKIKNGFITHRDGDEQFLVSTGETKFSGIVRSNPTAAFIIDCLMQETTPEEIVGKMQEKWDVSHETALRDVEKVLGGLREIDAIEE